MGKWSRFFFLILSVGLFMAISPLEATEDSSSYQVAVNPDFLLEGQSYGQFETPVYNLDQELDNLLISVDMIKAPNSLVRSYARFLNQKTGRWTRYQAFDGEFHFADITPVSAYQLMFVVRDPDKGKTEIRRFTVQGTKLGEAIMEALSQKPAQFNAARVWPKPSIVSREGWKARPPKAEYTPHQPQRIVIHHSWSPTQAQYTGAATIRGIQNYHMDDPSTGWMDIGYHFLIGPEGIIYQGRPETVVGAHCPPNTNMVGICIIGNYDPNADNVNAKIESSLTNLLSWLSSTYHIDPRVNYFGHRNFSTKTCPGDIVYNRLPLYEEQVIKNIGELK
ncbi:MAG: N-acetylmuramoyl-L-alanine amidase [Candidatus Riflebacteria bacterium]|nr:N-acetylmuramoyl-L-alanine amidase [Candidatus Riflebacteria bacterium]